VDTRTKQSECEGVSTVSGRDGEGDQTDASGTIAGDSGVDTEDGTDSTAEHSADTGTEHGTDTGAGSSTGTGTGRDDIDPAEEGYALVRSLDTGSVAKTAVGTDRIALASVSGGISVLGVGDDVDEQTQFGVDGRPRGLAVGPLLYVALDGRVLGFDDDGSRRFEADVDGVVALGSLPGASLLIAVTDGGELVGLDALEGTERFRTERPHDDVSEHVALAGWDEAFLSGASWYLTALGLDGEILDEVDLDGSITAMGALSDLAVVALRDGRLVGVDVESGATHWTQDCEVDWLAPRGSQHLYAASDGRIFRVSEDGTIRDVVRIAGPDGSGAGSGDSSGDAEGRVATTTAGTLACRIAGRTVEVFRPRASLPNVELHIPSTSIREGDDVDVAVESRGVAVEGSVSLRSEDASFRPESRSVTLDADERATVSFVVADAAASSVAVTAGFAEEGAETEDTLSARTEETLRVRPASTDPPAASDTSASEPPAETPDSAAASESGAESTAVSIEAACRRIEHGAAVVDVTVRTDEGATLPRVSISPGELTVEPTSGQSSLQRTVSVPLDSPRVSVTPDRGDRDDVGSAEPIERALSLPDRPLSVTVEAGEEGFVDVAFENAASVPIEDEARVTGAVLPDAVERPISLSPGARLTLALPAVDDGPAEIRVETAAATASEAIRIEDAAFGLARREVPSRTPGADEGAEPPVDASATAGAQDATPSTESARDTERSAFEDDPDTSGFEFEDEGRAASAQPAEADSDSGVSPVPFELSRDLGADAVPAGHAVQETIVIENTGTTPLSVTLASEADSESAEVEVPPEGSTRMTRYHAAWDADTVSIPAVTARTPNGERSLPAASVNVEDAPVVVRPSLFVRDAETDVRVELRNNLDRRCTVSEIGSKGFSKSVAFDRFEVSPGAIETAETTYEGTPAEDPSLTFVRIEQRRRPIRTIAPVHRRASAPIDVAVESVDALSERDTNVVLRLENESDAALDVDVEATGDAPDDYLYSMSTIEALVPGETATHRVECTVDDDHIELPVELRIVPALDRDGTDPNGDDADVNGDNADVIETTVVVSGDRDKDADAWNVETVTDGDAAESDALSGASTLSTPFARR
jgi:hypothetical protein